MTKTVEIAEESFTERERHDMLDPKGPATRTTQTRGVEVYGTNTHKMRTEKAACPDKLRNPLLICDLVYIYGVH